MKIQIPMKNQTIIKNKMGVKKFMKIQIKIISLKLYRMIKIYTKLTKTIKKNLCSSRVVKIIIYNLLQIKVVMTIMNFKKYQITL